MTDLMVPVLVQVSQFLHTSVHDFPQWPQKEYHSVTSLHMMLLGMTLTEWEVESRKGLKVCETEEGLFW